MPIQQNINFTVYEYSVTIMSSSFFVASVPFGLAGLPGAAAVGAAGMRLPGQPQTGTVLLVSNLNEQVRHDHHHINVT